MIKIQCSHALLSETMKTLILDLSDSLEVEKEYTLDDIVKVVCDMKMKSDVLKLLDFTQERQKPLLKHYLDGFAGYTLKRNRKRICEHEGVYWVDEPSKQDYYHLINNRKNQ